MSPKDVAGRLRSIGGVLDSMALDIEHNGDLEGLDGPAIDECIRELEEIRDLD